MSEARLIDANALFDQIRLQANRSSLGETRTPEISGLEVISLIKEAPVIDAEPVRHGRWIFELYSYSTPKCSCCGWNMPYSEDSTMDARNYCPRCGAKMDGGADE